MSTGISVLIVLTITVLIAATVIAGMIHTKLFTPGKNWHDFVEDFQSHNVQF